MKAKKILFKCAAILQFISSAFVIILGGVIMLATKLTSGLLEIAYEDMQANVKEFGKEELIANGEFPAEFLDMTKDEFLAYMTRACNIVSIIMFITAIIGIIYGVFLIILARKYESKLMFNKGKKITLGVLAPFAMGISIPTILVIIALCIKDKQPAEVIQPQN